MDRSFFYGTDAQIATGSANFSTQIAATPTLFGLTSAQATAYGLVNASFQMDYNIAIAPATRTRVTVAAKNAARATLKAMAADLAKIIDGTSTVTDQQKISLGLSVRKTPAPVPAPTVRPAVDLVSVATRTVTVHVHDSASSNKRGKPAGAKAAWVYSFVGAAYPSDPSQWAFQGSTTRHRHSIVFPDSVASGSQVWICAVWLNGKQETGPISVPITTNIQGGGVSASANMKIAA